NGEANGVYNVVEPGGFYTRPMNDDVGVILVTTFTLGVWQKAMSARFNYDVGTLIADYEGVVGAEVLLDLAAAVDDSQASNIGSGSVSYYGIVPSVVSDQAAVRGSNGYASIRNGSGGLRINGANPFGNNADRTVEFVLTFANLDNDGAFFRSRNTSGDESGLGSLSLDSGNIVYTDPTGASTNVLGTSVIDTDRPLVFHLRYDLSESQFRLTIRYWNVFAGSAVTDTTVIAYTNVDSSNVATSWDADSNAHPNFDIHHAAIYNEYLSSAHLTEVWARAGLD
ncbi:MAG: hypothetical protein R3324_16970, partial [Halobacteriales archaeon]|nr:hypothetical protein [Halobacteriales archaeon]